MSIAVRRQTGASMRRLSVKIVVRPAILHRRLTRPERPSGNSHYPQVVVMVLEMIRRSEGPHETLYHVGPSGLVVFKLELNPRPDGRGYFMTALRALSRSGTNRSRYRPHNRKRTAPARLPYYLTSTIHSQPDNICRPRSSTVMDGRAAEHTPDERARLRPRSANL